MISNEKIADVYTDFSGLNQLRSQAQKKTPDALRAAAQQFEALFIQTMLENARASEYQSDLFSGSESNLYSSLFDQQIALNISKVSNFGIADAIYEQLSAGSVAAKEPWASRGGFITHILPAVEQAAKQLQVAPEAILSVAALETNWGRQVIQLPEGGSSFNLFGIKATPGWDGNRVSASTLEYAEGVMQRRTEPFRAYASAEQSVFDFANLIKHSPRYADATDSNSRSFFQALQQGGYATDPQYADKLNLVVNNAAIQRAFKK